MTQIQHDPGRVLLLVLEGMPASWGAFVGLIVVLGATLGPLALVAWKVPDPGSNFGTGLLALVGLIILAVRVPVHMELRYDEDQWRSMTASLGFMLRRQQRFRLSAIGRLDLERRFREHYVDVE